MLVTCRQHFGNMTQRDVGKFGQKCVLAATQQGKKESPTQPICVSFWQEHTNPIHHSCSKLLGKKNTMLSTGQPQAAAAAAAAVPTAPADASAAAANTTTNQTITDDNDN
jgi:hypothetical protein